MASECASVALSESQRLPLVERQGGILMAIFFHLMLLAIFYSWVIEHPTPPPPGQQIIHLALAPPQPLEELQQRIVEQEMPPTPQEVERTSNIGEEVAATPMDNTDLEEIGAPPVAREAPDETAAEQSPQEQRPVDENQTRPIEISESTRRLLEERTELASVDVENQIIMETQIQGRLYAEMEQQRARNADYISEGDGRGRRELDFSGVPVTIASLVLQRYGAEVGMGHIPPEMTRNEGPITVSAAHLGGETLTAHRGGGGEGIYISYGQELEAHMAVLEERELINRNVNPGRVAITRSVFAPERTLSGWVLTLREIEFVEVD
ncbi:cell envelope integrity protein TolA [Candidatus Sumerlaeota bacterium]|nr:cell envelope integrity protein TolA [Candidatus Sumerlaeota bacterium]